MTDISDEMAKKFDKLRETLEDISDSLKDFAREFLSDSAWTDLVEELKKLEEERNGGLGHQEG